jgi:sec-independent protein translocase protein TatC
MDERRLTFGEHLEELRLTVVLCLVSITAGTVVCFMIRDELLSILLMPVRANGLTLQTLQVIEPFIVAVKVALVGGIVVSFPFIAHFVWGFVGAGLYPHERHFATIFAPFSVILFLVGVAFCYFLVLPIGLGFLARFIDNPWVENGMQLSSYLSFTLVLCTVIGLAFELPLVMLFLQGMGLVDAPTLRRYRRHSILTAFVVAALATPPDPFTQLALAVAIVGLYEVGLVLGKVRWLRRSGGDVDTQGGSM